MRVVVAADVSEFFLCATLVPEQIEVVHPADRGRLPRRERLLVGGVPEHREHAGLAELGVIDAVVAWEFEHLPGVARPILDVELDGTLVGILLGVDVLLGAFGGLVVQLVHRLPAVCLVESLDELRALGVPGEIEHVNTDVDVVAAATAVFTLGEQTVPLGFAALLVEVIDVVAVALDQPVDGVVVLTGRPGVVLLFVSVEDLPLECVKQLLGEGDLVHLRRGRVLRDDRDPILAGRVESQHRRAPRGLLDIDRVSRLADKKQRLELDVLVDLERVRDVREPPRVVRLVLVPRDDLDRNPVLELKLSDLFDAGHPPRDDRLEFRVVQPVGPVDRDRLVVPVAVLPPDDVLLRIRRRGVVCRLAGLCLFGLVDTVCPSECHVRRACRVRYRGLCRGAGRRGECQDTHSCDQDRCEPTVLNH